MGMRGSTGVGTQIRIPNGVYPVGSRIEYFGEEVKIERLNSDSGRVELENGKNFPYEVFADARLDQVEGDLALVVGGKK